MDLPTRPKVKMRIFLNKRQWQRPRRSGHRTKVSIRTGNRRAKLLEANAPIKEMNGPGEEKRKSQLGTEGKEGKG